MKALEWFLTLSNDYKPPLLYSFMMSFFLIESGVFWHFCMNRFLQRDNSTVSKPNMTLAAEVGFHYFIFPTKIIPSTFLY